MACLFVVLIVFAYLNFQFLGTLMQFRMKGMFSDLFRLLEIELSRTARDFWTTWKRVD